ncbi:hypothetical protein QLQ12_25585 [Actinoplanes sp. NEAU-A12]|uniref:Adhesin domain-containing protein n=1 Tax=Actinoplanes sandaracinus TaxID=3045177 RepID=A0ABT6WQH8_9ACTN|nr:hypothetical protein [Actinoplanes sandaracinus]MDI6101996.1 hypothetical protein [Actinoplanes sandaracinus]
MISSPGLSSPAVSAPRASSEPISAPPEFGPASPAGPGRVSFGFSDGPIGGARPSRTRGDEPDDLPQRQRAEAGPSETGELPRRQRAETGPSETGELPRRQRADSEPAAGGDPSGRRHGGPSNELPTVRKAGNGTEEPAAFPSRPDPFDAGNSAAPGNAAWPEPFKTGPSMSDSGPLPGLATPPWPETGDAATPRVSGNEWERLDEPVVWADTPATAPTGSTAPTVPADRPRPRQSRLVTVGMALLGVVALAAVALTGVVYYSGGDNQISNILGGDDDDPRIVTGPLNDRTLATFELLAATDRVQVRIADLGEDLYRISSPEGTGIRPSADVRDDRLRVDVTRDNAGTGGEVEVLLAAKVRWTIRFSGYSAERIVDLSAGRIKGIELVGGTRRAEMTLAQAAGTVPMKITGGIEELTLRAPTGSPVRIKVGGGAGTVTAGARTLRDVAPGSTLTPKDWTTGNRYDIDAVAPVTLLTVRTGRAGESSAPSHEAGRAPRRCNHGRCR